MRIRLRFPHCGRKHILRSEGRELTPQYKHSREILPDVFSITLPLPGRKPGPVNVYLFKGAKNTLIDTGIVQTAGILRKALTEHHLDFSDIDEIIVTHGHPEHYGAAKRIVRAGKARVIAHAEDRAFIEKGYASLSGRYKNFLRVTGIPPSVGIMMRLLFVFFKRMADNCKVDKLVREGDEVAIGGYRAKIMETPGHSQGSVCIFLEKERIIFCGDTIIEHITPNAFVMLDEQKTLPVRLSQEEFYKSLTRLRALEPSAVYSAHGKTISDIDQIIAGYEKSFAERKDNVLAMVRDGEKHIYNMARRLFPDIGGLRLPLEIFLAISEVYTTIQVLQKEGRISLQINDSLLEVKELTGD